MVMVGCAVLSLSSCLLLDISGSDVNSDLSYEWKDSDYDDLKSNMTRFEKALSGDNQLELVGAWNSVQRGLYAVATYRTIENINYAAGDDDAYEKYIYFQGILEEVTQWQENLYDEMYNSKYKDDFFKGMTEEEIQKLINNVKPDRYYEIENAQKSLIKQYQDLSDDEVDTKTSDIYLSLVKNYKEEATLLGYDSYMDYAYEEIYSREYTPKDVEDFTTYVKDYIVPLMIEVKEEAIELNNSGLSNDSLVEFRRFNSGHFESWKSTINAYGQFVGGDYEKSLNFLWKEGYIKYGTAGKANIDGAFTTYLYAKNLNQPILYFGPSYTNLMTFIHEFGHYNNFKVNGANAMSYDLAETHSQGNEMLFLAWLEKNKDEQAKDLNMDLVRLNEVYEALTTIVLATMVNEFEYRVYTSGDDLDANSFDTYYREAGDALGGYDEIIKYIYGDNVPRDYWKRVVLENPAYYISYAISKIPSLEIYQMGREDLTLTRNCYRKTFNLDKDLTQEDFLKVLSSANIYSPFDEEAYKLIQKLK